MPSVREVDEPDEEDEVLQEVPEGEKGNEEWVCEGGAEDGGLSADGGGTNVPDVAGPCNQNAVFFWEGFFSVEGIDEDKQIRINGGCIVDERKIEIIVLLCRKRRWEKFPAGWMKRTC